jgi:hypothetical protein
VSVPVVVCVAESEPAVLEERPDDLVEAVAGLGKGALPAARRHDRWHNFLADPTVADAVCDRVLHGAHKLDLEGPSRRKTRSQRETSLRSDRHAAK